MPGAAGYNHKAAFFRMVPGQDAAGVEVMVPAPIAAPYANVRYGDASERRVAAGTEAGQVFTVRVKATRKARSVKVSDRVTVRDLETGLEISGAITSPPVPASGGDIEFTAAAAIGAAA